MGTADSMESWTGNRCRIYARKIAGYPDIGGTAKTFPGTIRCIDVHCKWQLSIIVIPPILRAIAAD